MPFDGTDYRRDNATDDYTIESVAVWLRTKNPQESYNPACINNCLIAQYGKAHGVTRPLHRSPWSASLEEFSHRNLDRTIGAIAYNGTHTFGAARQRAERRLAIQKGVGFFKGLVSAVQRHAFGV